MTVVGRVVAASMIVAGSIALGGSAQAAAVTVQADSTGQITSPSDGEVISGSSVTVSARTGLMQLSMGLYVEGPSMPTQKVAGGGANQTVSGTFDIGSAPNGTFTVTLKGEITGTRYDTSTFKLRRPAEAPGNVSASRQGSEKVLVTWSKGSEPDLQSYEVSNSQSGVVGRLSADSACSGSSCKAALAVPGKAAGQKVGFTVKAFRGDGDGGSIGSSESAPAYLAFPAAPTVQPTKKATTTTDQTPKSREARGVDALPTLPAKKQTLPKAKPTATRKPATTSKLPDIPDADASGNLPIPTADSKAEDPGENGALVPADAKKGEDSAPVQSDGVKAQSNESPIGNIGQYGIYVAGGILLLLVGAHAGAWARRRALAPGGGDGGGSVSVPAAATGGGGGGAPVVNAVQADAGASADLGARGAAQAGVGDEGVSAPVAAVRRRPAVILAVAKTRMPEAPRADQPSAADRPQVGQGETRRSEDRPGAAGRHQVERHQVERHQVERHQVERHQVERHQADRELVDPELGDHEPRERGVIERRAVEHGMVQRGVVDQGVVERGVVDRMRVGGLQNGHAPAGGLQDDHGQAGGGQIGRADVGEARGGHAQAGGGEAGGGQVGRGDVGRARSGPVQSEGGQSGRVPVGDLESGRPQVGGGQDGRVRIGGVRSGHGQAGGGEVGGVQIGGGQANRAQVDGEQGSHARVGGVTGRGQGGHLQAGHPYAGHPYADRARTSASERVEGGRASRSSASGDLPLRLGSVSGELSSHLGADEAREVEEPASGGAGPMRIALPSSAVTDVPEGLASVAARPMRLEERWDDYLPPSPRSMEDSGFWERPQPGAADFWAADDDGNGNADGKGNGKGATDAQAYAGRRHQGGES